MIKYVVLFVVSVLLTVNVVVAEQINDNRITVVTPEFYNGANKQGQGFYFDMMHAIYDPLHIKIDYQIMPYSRASHMIETKQADVIFSIYSAALVKRMTQKDVLLTPKYPVTVERLSAVFTKKSNVSWRGMDTLSNKKVAWIRGYSYQYFLDVPVQMEELNSYEQVFPLLERGRIDFYIDALADINHALQKYKIDSSQYQIGAIATHNLYIGFSNTPKSEYLVTLFDQRMNELIKSGQLDAIYKKWGIEPPDSSVDDR